MEFKNILWIDLIFKEKFGFVSERLEIKDNNLILITKQTKKEYRATFEYHNIVHSTIKDNDEDYWKVTFIETQIEEHPIKSKEDYK